MKALSYLAIPTSKQIPAGACPEPVEWAGMTTTGDEQSEYSRFRD
jgi:hypothetical protein